MQQLLFDFAQSYIRDSWDRFDTFVAGENAYVLSLLINWLNNPLGKHAYVFGGPSSGCSRLLYTSCRYLLEQGKNVAFIQQPLQLLDGEQLQLVERHHLLVLDNLDSFGSKRVEATIGAAHRNAVEEALYELFDRTHDLGCALLFAGHAPVSELSITLPDLRTRMGSCLQLALRPLSDGGLEQLAEQLLLECGVTKVPPGLGRLVLTYCKRDSANVVAFIRTMQLASLDQRKPVSAKFVHDYVRHVDSSLS